jgi:hypothetical protein
MQSEVDNVRKAGYKLIDYITEGAVQWQKMDDTYDIAVFRTSEQQRRMLIEVREEFPMRSRKVQQDLKERFPAPEDHAAIDKYFRLVRAGAKSIQVCYVGIYVFVCVCAHDVMSHTRLVAGAFHS